MELLLQRVELTNFATFGKLYVDGKFVCDTLEDRDRGLKDEWELATILAKKIPHETAIPTGRYEVAVTFSKRFQKPLPELLKVKGFEGIRIHAGNTHYDTSGCILPGTREGDNVVESRKAFKPLYRLIGEALLEEEVWITIERLA